ncbi:MAG: hypothetical protein FJ302_18570 [Planctomycetes bacterium]|nr:hypothetical protein [Planctomycetota bacterium]
MTHEEGDEGQEQKRATSLYHTALVRALIFQVALAALASLILDGGIFRRAFCGASVGYWIIAVVVLVVRPARWGLQYLQQGVWIVFVLVVAIDSIWHENIVDLVGG